MKKEYNIKDRVWIHIGERRLVEGRVVEIIDLEHLNEGHDPSRELYVIELKTGIDDIYEVRSFEQISPDAKGPINCFRDLKTKTASRFLKKIGIQLPIAEGVTLDEMLDEDEEEPTPEQIHAAMEAAEKAQSHIFQPTVEKPKRAPRPKRKPFNRRKKNDA